MSWQRKRMRGILRFFIAGMAFTAVAAVCTAIAPNASGSKTFAAIVVVFGLTLTTILVSPFRGD